MSTSHGNQVSLARHNYPQSPFNRAREPNYEFDLDTSNFPTPSKQDGTRPRNSYRTSTLAGAYRAASRASMEENVQMGLSPSPRQARAPFGALSPNSDTSNPRADTMDMYGRIEEDAAMATRLSNGWDSQRGSRTASWNSRTSRDREYDEPTNHGLAISEPSIFSDIDRYSPRRRNTDYSKDEQRLRRVTGKDSPVFSRAKVGARAALTADNLSRREEEQAEELEVENQRVSEDDNERYPSLNLPSTWGSRATRREWPRNVSQRSASDQSKENDEEQPTKQEPIFQTHTTQNDTSTQLRFSPRSLEREQPRMPTRNALQERTFNPPMHDVQDIQDAPEPEPTEKTSKRKFDYDQNSPDANPIPNTPIVVFKANSLTRPNYPKRDSQDLLRRLSRTESPKMEQMQTPEPPKLFERRIYDKTPRVTGAWIDTPMTEKVTQIPSDLTKDIIPPPSAKEPAPPVQETKPPVEVQTRSEDPKPEAPTEAPKHQAPRPGVLKESKSNGFKEPTGPKAPKEEPKPTKPRPEVHRPKLPKSGLETVMEDVNSGKEALDLGDDTIESLRAIMDDPVDSKTESEEEAAYEQEVLERLRLAETRLNDGSRSFDFDRLNEKLASLASNVNQVKKGLDNLETKVSKERTVTPQPITSIKKGTGENCEHGVLQHDGRVYAAIPVPRLWTHNPSTGRRQPTILGVITLGFLLLLQWYVIECMMIEIFSHPIISTTCDGYCLQPDAPEFPFVTVTMLWRWSHLSTLLTPIITVLMAVARLLAQLLGLWDGYVDEPTAIGSLIGEIRINGTPVSFPWLSSTTAAQVITPPQQTVQPIWMPRQEPPRQEPPRQHPTPVKWDDDQPSMDEDEYI